MNKITMTLQVDHLILEALKEDISSEDVTTNSVMKEAVPGEVDLLRCDCLSKELHLKDYICGSVRRLHEQHISQKYAYSALFFWYPAM